MSQYFLYYHCYPDGTPFYVGRGVWTRTKQMTSGRNTWHQRIVEKLGKQNVLIKAHPVHDFYHANVLEQCAIAKLKTAGIKLCNLTAGGDGTQGYKHKPEAIAKMKVAKQNMSLETRDKMADIARNRTFTDETREAMRQGRLGKKHSEATLEKMRAARTAYWAGRAL